MKFIFENADVLVGEKYIAEKRVINPRRDILKVSLEFISNNPLQIPREFIPLGTVKFCSAHMKNIGVLIPGPLDYPSSLRKYLGREVKFGPLSDAPDNYFVKPYHTKEFTCDVKSEIEDREFLNCEGWISEPIPLTQEYRVYVLKGQIHGYSRYDNLNEDDILPDFNLINEMIASYENAPVAYTLDVGLSNHKTVLIEVNDMWAIGYYKHGTLTADQYIELISERWYEIIKFNCRSKILTGSDLLKAVENMVNSTT
jgi:hypothetical protein